MWILCSTPQCAPVHGQCRVGEWDVFARVQCMHGVGLCTVYVVPVVYFCRTLVLWLAWLKDVTGS